MKCCTGGDKKACTKDGKCAKPASNTKTTTTGSTGTSSLLARFEILIFFNHLLTNT